MNRKSTLTMGIATVWLAALGGLAISAQDSAQTKYAVKVPGGLAFSEFKGYEAWQTISISRNENVMAVITAVTVVLAFDSTERGRASLQVTQRLTASSICSKT